jgi:hypothetical protein
MFLSTVPGHRLHIAVNYNAAASIPAAARAAKTAPVSRGAPPVLVEVSEVDEDDDESEEEDEEEEDDDDEELEPVSLAAVPELVSEDSVPVPVVVADAVARTPPRKEVPHTGRELASDLSSGQSLRTEEMDSELLLNQDWRLELKSEKSLVKLEGTVAEQGFLRSEAVNRRTGGVGRPLRRPRMSVVQDVGRSGMIPETPDWRGSRIARFI